MFTNLISIQRSMAPSFQLSRQYIIQHPITNGSKKFENCVLAASGQTLCFNILSTTRFLYCREMRVKKLKNFLISWK